MSPIRNVAVSKGAEMIPCEVAGIGRDEAEVRDISLSDGTRIKVGALVNAAGAGAGALAALAGVTLPVGPRKRYVYVLDCHEATEALHRAPLTVDPSGLYFRPEGLHLICRPWPPQAA